MKARERHDRRDWLIIFFLILLGFLCILLTSGWALRFAPNWRLETSMESRLDPNSNFLNSRPDGYFEPLDPSILTQPAWMNVFLTPGASFATRTPAPASTSVNTVVPVTPTIKPPSTPLPTNTLVFFPSPTSIYIPPSTPKPPSPTSPPSTISVDLQITKDDGSPTYIAGSTLDYIVVVTNNGSNGVTAATVTDIFSTNANIASANWTCSGAGGATCNTASGSGDINSSNGGVVNLPVGSSVTYTVTVNSSASPSGNLVNTASVAVPSGYIDPNTSNNTATDTDTPAFSSDLAITTNTDNSTDYIPSATKMYTIVVSNAGPSDVTNATFTDNFNPTMNANITSWTCSATGLATCTASGGAGNINDTVDIPVGNTLTYTVTANVVASPSGTLDNMASVSSATDPNNLNNSATDTDQLIQSVPFPVGQINDTQDFTTTTIPSGTSVTLAFGTPLTVGGNPSWDIVYYELQNVPGIQLDQVILQISDGSNWYTIFNWGNGFPNTNTIIPAPLLPPNPTDCAGEPDNCTIDGSFLYNTTGIAIDLDGLVQDGTYYYVRIISPAGDAGMDGVEVDAIYVFPFP